MAIQKRQLLMAKREAVYGTDPTPAAGTDSVLVIDDLSLSQDVQNADVDLVDALLDPIEHVRGSQLLKLSFTTPLRGSGSAGSVPDCADLLKAVGFSETIVGGVSVTYAPASAFGAGATGYQSATLYLDDGVNNVQMQGAYGTVSLELSANGFGKLKWEFTALYEKPTDLAAIPSPTYDTTRPQPCRGLTYSVAAYAGRATSLSLALNREVHRANSMASAFGVAALELGRCKPDGSYKVYADPIASNDYWGQVENGTVMNWSFVVGGTAGNIVTVRRPAGNTAGGMKWKGLNRVEDNGVLYYEMPFDLGRHSGNDVFEVVFT